MACCAGEIAQQARGHLIITGALRQVVTREWSCWFPGGAGRMERVMERWEALVGACEVWTITLTCID